MTALTLQQDLCRQFGLLLCYPDKRLGAQTAACLAQLEQVDAEAAAALQTFHRFVETHDIRRIEEAFTGTFDLQSLCHPYVGYQLCGESQQRTMFMLKLREIYRQHDFTPANELPDHLTEVLRFIGSIDDPTCRLEIIRDGILPALAKMIQGLENHDRPYLALLNALQRFLTAASADATVRLPADRHKETSS